MYQVVVPAIEVTKDGDYIDNDDYIESPTIGRRSVQQQHQQVRNQVQQFLNGIQHIYYCINVSIYLLNTIIIIIILCATCFTKRFIQTFKLFLHYCCSLFSFYHNFYLLTLLLAILTLLSFCACFVFVFMTYLFYQTYVVFIASLSV